MSHSKTRKRVIATSKGTSVEAILIKSCSEDFLFLCGGGESFVPTSFFHFQADEQGGSACVLKFLAQRDCPEL